MPQPRNERASKPATPPSKRASAAGPPSLYLLRSGCLVVEWAVVQGGVGSFGSVRELLLRRERHVQEHLRTPEQQRVSLPPGVGSTSIW